MRGAFTLQIPPLKRVQLEIMYDLNADETGKAPEGEFFVEVFERNRVNPAEWVKMGELAQQNDRKREEPPVKQMGNERYIGRSYVANLSEWSGKEIRLDVVSAFATSKSAIPKGRWICMKMMGATFDFHFLTEGEEDKGLLEIDPGLIPAHNMKTYSRQSKNLPTYLSGGSINYASETIPISGIGNCPESFASFVRNSGSTNWVMCYFQAGNSYYTQGEWPGTGSVACDLSTASNFYSANSTSINNSMIRDINSVLYRSSNPNYPVWRALSPVRDKDHWANGMTAISSAFQDGEYFHAFFHAEDWYKNPPTKNYAVGGSNGWWAYSRIGYARSNQNDPYRQNITSSLNSGPIITSRESESALSEIAYPTGAVIGAAHPLLLKKDNYYYLYYNRIITPTYYVNDVYPNSLIRGDKLYGRFGKDGVSLCVARAECYKVTASNYTSLSNPWKKYWSWNFSEDGIGGLSTPLFDKDDGLPHEGYLVPVSVMDHTGLNEFLYVFMNPSTYNRPYNRMYLCLSSLKDPCWIQNCIEVPLPSSNTWVSGMVSTDGYGSKGSGHYMKIYAHDRYGGLPGFHMSKYTLYLDY